VNPLRCFKPEYFPDEARGLFEARSDEFRSAGKTGRKDRGVSKTGTAAFVVISYFFAGVKYTALMACYLFDDRLTTGMSSAEPVQGCTYFGVSPKR
tara:strand:+ start:14801 stop:15088 length:288 start_codon:yes stop_codon:yes gene_type:complete